MRCEICIDPAAGETYAVITAAADTPEVQAAAELLRHSGQPLHGYTAQGVRLLRPEQVLRVFAEHKKVYVQAVDGEVCTLRSPLYEVEKQLSDRLFVRISNAEIVNSSCISHLDVSLAGTVGVWLDGGVRTFASRRYVQHIKKFFGL